MVWPWEKRHYRVIEMDVWDYRIIKAALLRLYNQAIAAGIQPDDIAALLERVYAADKS